MKSMKKPAKIVIISALCLILVLGIVASVFLLTPKKTETEKAISWTLFTEDFEAYQSGDDAFFDAAAEKTGAAFPWWDGMRVQHGSATDPDYAQYGIGGTSGSQYLQLKSANKMQNRVVTKNAVSGPYTVKLDFQLTEGAPQLIVNLFEGSVLGDTIVAYLEPSGARIYNSKDQISDAVQTAEKTPVALSMNTWYTMEFGFAEGQATLSVWKTGEDISTKQTAAKVTSDISAAITNSSNTVSVQLAHDKKSTAAALVDNFSISKNVTLRVQEYVSAATGKVMDTLPTGSAANQLPVPSYSYTLADTTLGSVDASGQLVAGSSEGKTELTLNLLDIRGKETGISFKTTLVIDNTNAISLGDDIQISTNSVDKSQTLTPVLADAYKNATIRWTSSDESVVTVKDGVLTCNGQGTAQITAMIMDGSKQTHHYDTVQVQVGDAPLRVLTIGNYLARDTLYYLNKLARLAGMQIDISYLTREDGSVRDHAYNLSYGVADYALYATNPNGEFVHIADSQTIHENVESQEWDVIILEHNHTSQGIRGTYSSDLKYLVDYLEDVQPNAKLYWNMAWTLQTNHTSSTTGFDFLELYSANPNIMYNNLATLLDDYIIGEDASFSSTNANNLGTGIGWGFDGYLPNGTAIQLLRSTIDHDLELTRNGYQLSLDIGRMTTGLTALKALYPDLDLSVFTADKIASIMNTSKRDYDSVTGKVMATDKSSYTYTDADLPKIIAAAEKAVADGLLEKLPVPEPARPEDTNDQVFSSVIAEAPQKLHFPDVKSLADGTLIAGAYECLVHYPMFTNENADPYEVLEEGTGRIVIYESTDNGKTWSYDNPVLVVDEAQLEKWGVYDNYNRYAQIGVASGQDYIAMTDPRDPNFGTAIVDFDNDGDMEQVVLFTFWERSYTSIGRQRGFTLWILTGVKNTDGTYTWVSKPTQVDTPATKRGDMAVFSDGTILVPTYYGGKAHSVNMTWDAKTQTWAQHDTIQIPNLAEYEDLEFNEVSLIAPDPDSDTVLAFCRQNGAVQRSFDRGVTWELIGNEKGIIHQPGFALIDENRLFVTWAKPSSPRPTWGKVFYFNDDWADTPSREIYASDSIMGGDSGDPSCALTADGKIVVVSYDTNYRAMITNIIDPNDEKWLPKDAD